MKTKLIYTLIGLILFSASFSAVYAYGISTADRLKKGSLFCLTPILLTEAREAIDTDNAEWADQIKACMVTNQELRVKSLQCGISNCLVRYFSDTESFVGFVEHRGLYRN